MKASGCILATMVSLLISVVSLAQTTDSLRLHRVEKRYNIFFPINSSKIEGNFQDNSRTIETIRQDILNTLANGKSLFSASDSILILSTASPDGSYEFNRNLARRRASSTSKLLQDILPEFNASNIKVECLEENWDGLRQILKADPDFPQREEMLMIIESSLQADEKERALRNCIEGWEHLISNHVYALRSSSITLTVLGVRDEYTMSRDLEHIERFCYTPVLEFLKSGLTYDFPVTCYPVRHKVASVRTNLLSPLSNIGVEVCINDRWSVEGDYYFPWLLRNEDHRNAIQLLAWGITGRYWLGHDRTYVDRLLGHSVGLGTYAGYYDLERDFAGHQGEFVSVYLDYLYAMPVFRKKMHMEFTIGLGYLYSKARPYDVFEPGGKAFKKGYTKNIHWVGPVKAGVTLVVPIHATRK